MSLDKINGYVAVVTRQTDNRPLLVPGMETYFASYPVEVFASPQQLLDKLSRSNHTYLPRLVVMDLMQSTSAGLDAIQAMKANERLRSIPVLMRRVSTDWMSYRTVKPVKVRKETTTIPLERPMQAAALTA